MIKYKYALVLKPASWGNTTNISSKIRSNTRLSTVLLSFNIVLEVLANASRQDKPIRDIRIGKEVKLSLFTDDILMDLESPKVSMVKPNQNNRFQKSNRLQKKYTKVEKTLFIIAIEKIKYLRINLT